MTCSGDPRLIPSWRRPPGDEVGGAGVLDHVQRVLVAHVDDGRADLDALGPRADRRQERERRRELLGEVVDPEVGAVGTQILDRLGELDRLDERVRRRPHLRVGRGRPMPEREEPDLLHAVILRTTAPTRPQRDFELHRIVRAMTQTDTTASGDQGLSSRSKLLLALILTGQFMAVLDASIVNVAIPTIRLDLQRVRLGPAAHRRGLRHRLCGPADHRRATRHALRLPDGVPVGPRALHGGVAACGLAPTSQALIVVRAIQGGGAALMVPQVFSLIQRNFTGPSRAQALSLWAATLALGGLVGQVLGGVLVSADLFGTGWRPVFLVNVPIGLVLLVASFRLLPDRPPRARPAARSWRPDLARRGGPAPRRPAGPWPRAGLAGLDLRLAGAERRRDRRLRADRAVRRAPRRRAADRGTRPPRAGHAGGAGRDRPRARGVRRLPVHVHAAPAGRPRAIPRSRRAARSCRWRSGSRSRASTGDDCRRRGTRW